MRLRGFAAAVTSMVAAAACARTPVEVPALASVRIAPDSAVVPLGDTLQLSAEVRDVAGRLLDTLTAPRTWRVAPPTRLLALPGRGRGRVVAADTGGAVVIAVVGPVADTVRVRVPAPVARLSVDSLVLAPGDTVSVTATFEVAPGVDRAATRGIAWRVSDATIAEPRPATGPRTVVRALRTGAVMLRADFGGIAREIPLAVRP